MSITLTTFVYTIYINNMNNTQIKPNFLTVWKSKRIKEKTILKQEFITAAGKNGIPASEMTFYRKKQSGDWTELEKEWWAKRLDFPKEILFPEKDWLNQGELSQHVKNQLIG
jgi:hypothetical protein